jgi:hypothetical protein
MIRPIPQKMISHWIDHGKIEQSLGYLTSTYQDIYTAFMKQQRLALLLIILVASLASCSPGHLGSNVIAFLRDGHLWTIDPNGANAFDTVAQDTAVIGYTWSPNHQLLAFRTLDSSFARTAAARQLESNPLTEQISDIPSTINTIGVDGGTPIPIAFSSPQIRYSQATWNISGTRLLYRQTPTTAHPDPGQVAWWISQNDQPGGIALKALPESYSLPSLSYIIQQQKTIGNSIRGIFTTTLAGTNMRYIRSTPLSGHPLPATLERILWQPAHQDTHFLYAIPASTPAAANVDRLTLQLVLGSVNGQNTPLATCTCTQFTWSPDGNSILSSDGTNDTILRLADHSSFTIRDMGTSVPYWSPDSQFLLLDGRHTLVLVQVAQRQETLMLSDSSTAPTADSFPPTLPATNDLLQPVANSIWAADSRHFLFLTHNRLLWCNTPLRSGKGLYTVEINNAGQPQGSPTIVDTGNDSQAGWNYQDANASFLY